ncbi:MAG: MFS transporter [Candidatus Nanohaloarchaea archaeon]
MLGFFQDHTIDQIYAYEMLQKFAFGLIGIFIPIYIASQGSPLQWVFLFLLVDTVTFMVAAIPVSYFIANIGFKHSLVVSYLFYLPAFIALQKFGLTLELVAFSAFFLGIGKALHWIALHAEFAVDSEEDTRGKASGRLLGLPRISRAIAPFLGGLIMTLYGFNLLISVSVFFMLMSAIPLLASRDHRDPLEYSLRSLVNRKHAVFGSLFVLRGVTIAAGAYLFPLFVFYVVGGTVNAGGAKSLASLGSVAFALLIGRVTDSIEKKHMILVGTIASGILFALRVYVTEPVEAFLVSFVAGLMFMVYYVPLYSTMADWAEDEDVLEFYAFREVFLCIGRIATYGLALYVALAYSIAAGLKAAFMLAAGAATLLALYSRWIK